MAVPVVAMPAPTMRPTPMAATPTPVAAVPSPVPVPAMSPADLFWFDLIDLVAGGNSRTGNPWCGRRTLARQRRGRERYRLRAHGKSSKGRGKTSRNLHKVAPFHKPSPLRRAQRVNLLGEFCGSGLNGG